jgi:hypothetical protein
VGEGEILQPQKIPTYTRAKYVQDRESRERTGRGL